MSTGVFDHLVIGGEDLDRAAAHVEALLGIAPAGGGAHPGMGTHNRLLSLGPRGYVEALAVNPAAPAPGVARWFGLDDFAGPARAVGWALAVDDLDAALETAGDLSGPAFGASRGAYRWRIALPTGRFGALWPALIEWQGAAPAADLPDTGARLVSLILSHPKAGALGWALSQLTEDDRIVIREGKAALRALIHAPAGERVLE